MGHDFQRQLTRLRAVEPEDWEKFHQWNQTDGGRTTDEVWFPSSKSWSQQWSQAQAQKAHLDDNFRFMIETLAGELVGTLNTHECNLRCGTFMYGIYLDPAQRGKGYAADAVRVLLRYMFHERRYQKVNANVYSFNAASITFHEKFGFTLEGRLRRVIYTEGQFFDTLIFGMTREEFEQLS